MGTTKNKELLVITNINDISYHDDKEVLLDFRKENQKFYLDSTQETDDGTWPTVNDWINFMSKLFDNGNDAIVDFYFGDKTESQWDDFKLIKDENQGPDFQRVRLVFETPVKFIFGQIGYGDNKEFVTREVNELWCNFDHEGFTMADSNVRLQHVYVSGIEIYLTDIVIIK